MNAKAKLMLGALAVVAAGGLLIGNNLQESVSFFRRPSELKTLSAQALAQPMRLGGVVMPGSLKRHSGSILKEFVMFEKDTGVRVRYRGILPDLFQEGKPALAEGHFVGTVFEAKSVVAKHDENYTPAEMKGVRPDDLVAPALSPETEHLIYTGPDGK